jgi:hypothetical protein
MGWTFVWLMIGLKVPIAALLYIVHWAIKQTDVDAPASDGGGGVRPPHRPRVPGHPRRRGPHGAPSASGVRPRVRRPAVTVARATAGRHT